MSELSTEELAAKVKKIAEQLEGDRKRRHDLNNNLSATLLSMSSDIMRHNEGMSGMENLGQIVVALDHIVRGVDGKNGLRGNYQKMNDTIESVVERFADLEARIFVQLNEMDKKQTEKFHNLDVKMAAMAAGFAVAGQFAVTMVTKWIS